MRGKIAVIGLSGLFPGNKSAEEFWKCLISNQSLITKASEKEFGKDANYFYNPRKNTRDKSYCINGAYLSGFEFNAKGYNIAEEELLHLDDTFKWVLHSGKDVLEKSGYWNAPVLERCGLIVGNLSFPTKTSRAILNSFYSRIAENAVKNVCNLDSFSLPRIDNTNHWNLNNAFSGENLSALTTKALGLGARHFSIDAACSSSLYAIEIASGFLNSNKADMMLAGAVSCADPLFISMGFSFFNAFPSPHETSRPFDKNSAGLTPGEGAGFVLLKRYEDAVKDNDKIHAVIYNTGLSNDGKGKFVLSPNKKGQLDCFKKAYSGVAISPEDIGYIECHATGTALGDATEIESIREFFGESNIPYLGAVKSNTGHLLTAAGMAGIVKVINALNTELIPATVGVENPLAFNNKILTENTAWPANRPKLAAVNAFGFGGANAHLIIGAHSTAADFAGVNKESQKEKIAVTGIDVCLGEIRSLKHLSNVIQNNIKVKHRLPQNRWNGIEDIPDILQQFNLSGTLEGNYIDDFDFETLRYKIPPREAAIIVPQQLLTLKTADEAIKKSGLKQGANVGVIIAMQPEQALHKYTGRWDLNWQFEEAETNKFAQDQELSSLNNKIKDFIHSISTEESSVSTHTGIVGNLIACRISALWDFSGPAFTVSCGEDSFTKALETAQLMMQNGTCDGVVVGAVDFAGGVEHLILRSTLDSIPAHVCEGAAVFVLQNESTVNLPEEKIIAYLDEVNVFENCISETFSSIGGRNKVAYAEFAGSAVNNKDIVNAINACLKPLKTGSITPNTGYAYTASGAVSFAKALINLSTDISDKAAQQAVVSYNEKTQTAGILLLSAGKTNIHFGDGDDLQAGTTASVKKIINGGTRYSDFIKNVSLQSNDKIKYSINTTMGQTQTEEAAQKNNVAYTFDEAVKGVIPVHKKNHSEAIWNEKDLLEFAGGSIAKVFGREYAIIDTYSRKVRLPLPPYLLVSRVTKINAKTGEFKPSSMTTEYDIPYNAWYSVDGQVPWAVSVESGQCDLMLISYLGIDFENKGERVYRLLDCTLTFLDELPKEGDTLRYDISINSFVRNGNNLLFFFSYNCYVGEKMVLKMTNGCAGFFSYEELEEGQGVVRSKKEIELRSTVKKRNFVPIKNTTKTTFTKEDLLHLVNGKPELCFGKSYNHQWRNPSLKLPSENLLMIDRVTEVNPQGGPWGLGLLVAEKDLGPDQWYFPCHFKDDEVLAGSLQAEGGGQLLQFFMLYLGMHGLVKDARFQPIEGLPQKVRCRKQVTPKNTKLTYRMEIKEISLIPEPRIISDVEVLTEDGLVAVHFENLGLRLKEKNNSHLIAAKNASDVKPLLNEEQIANYALGSLVKVFGSEFEPFENRVLSRQPNTDLQVVSRVVSFNGQRHNFNNKPTIVCEYDVPLNPWYYAENASPTMPYSVLMEIALQPCGVLTSYLGSCFIYPDKDVFFRNLDGEGTLSESLDLRGKTITNKAVLTAHTAYEGNIIQKFTFEMMCNGKVFYKGTAAFGFFPKSSLVNQVGLDRGEEVPAWFKTIPASSAVKQFDLNNETGQHLFRIQKAKKHFRLSQPQLNFLDKLVYVANGGVHGKGYIYGFKEVDPADWFYNCHFYQDPVMPGSLGVEAMMQAMQAFSIIEGLGDNYINPAFMQLVNHQTQWKYRGQIVPENKSMSLEVHIVSVTTSGNQTIVTGEGSLWKENIRIYEIKNLALAISETNQ